MVHGAHRPRLRVYVSRDERGEHLAHSRLAGTQLVPETISFPPIRVRVGGWPASLIVNEATERVACTLHQKITELVAAERFDEVEKWLDRLLDLRRATFRRHGNRVVLTDPGGLTSDWQEIETCLAHEDGTPPRVRLGLAGALEAHPEIAERFDWHWIAAVNLPQVRSHWPGTGVA